MVSLCFLVSALGCFGQASIPLSKFADSAEKDAVARLGGWWAAPAKVFETFDRIVPRSRLPADVAENATDWAGMVLRRKCLPGNIDDLWVGYKRARSWDAVAATYSVEVGGGRYDVAVIDNARYIDILIRRFGPPKPVQAQNPDEALRGAVIDVAKSFLRVPRGWETSFLPTDKARRAFLSDEASGTGPSIWYGMLRTVNKEGRIISGEKGQSSWFDHLIYWTDGNTYAIEVMGWDHGREKWPRIRHGDRGWNLPGG